MERGSVMAQCKCDASRFGGGKKGIFRLLLSLMAGAQFWCSHWQWLFVGEILAVADL